MAAPQERRGGKQCKAQKTPTQPDLGNLSVIVKKIMLKKIMLKKIMLKKIMLKKIMLKKTEGDCGGKQIDDVNTLHKYKYIYQIRDRSKLRPICKSKF